MKMLPYITLENPQKSPNPSPGGFPSFFTNEISSSPGRDIDIDIDIDILNLLTPVREGSQRLMWTCDIDLL